MNHDLSLRFALIASCIFLALGYILTRMHAEDPIQIRVLPLKHSSGTEETEPFPADSAAEPDPLASQRSFR